MLFNYVLQHIPHCRLKALYHLFGVLDVRSVLLCNQLLHNERLKELNGHLLRKTALVDLQLRSNDDNGTSGVVNSLSEQVLAETSLLTL